MFQNVSNEAVLVSAKLESVPYPRRDRAGPCAVIRALLMTDQSLGVLANNDLGGQVTVVHRWGGDCGS